MSWSFQLHNGDFVTEAAHFATVRQAPKLLQDLRLHILEELGTDNLHPNYGTQIDDVIGEIDLDRAVLEVEAEIMRVLQEQQQQQLTRAKRDRFILGRATLDPGEVLVNVTGLAVIQDQDRLIVHVTLQTGDEAQIGLEVPLSTDNELG